MNKSGQQNAHSKHRLIHGSEGRKQIMQQPRSTKIFQTGGGNKMPPAQHSSPCWYRVPADAGRRFWGLEFLATQLPGWAAVERKGRCPWRLPSQRTYRRGRELSRSPEHNTGHCQLFILLLTLCFSLNNHHKKIIHKLHIKKQKMFF